MTRVWATIFWCILAAPATAQEGTYIQVEAQPTLPEGVAAAERYAAALEGVAGFRLGTSWYAVTIGPYPRQDAEAELRRLRFQGAIPGDAYLTTRGDYGAPFYPGGGTATEATQPVAQAEPDAVTDETSAEARRSERTLSREDRALIQSALEDAGVYDGPIDSAFGPGTRRAMADWQAANGYDPTGVLTTGQRIALVEAYRSLLDGLAMQRIADRQAGIEIALPTDVVARAGVESPFVRYEPTGDLPVRVLLISQEGDTGDLAALYDVMQTLRIVPPEGPRARRTNSFDLEGRNGDVVSTTYAEHLDGQIKGFTLVWPTGDERRRARVLERMRSSFARLPGVLPQTDGADTPAPDLLAGLEIRRPERDRSGFFVDRSGAVLTTSEAVRSCQRVTLDETVEMEVAAADESLGLALLRPRSNLSPIRYARFGDGTPALQSEIAVAGYPFGGALAAPSLNYGRVADSRGLDGDTSRNRLELEAEPGETGGPVFDGEGAVVGILLPNEDGSRRLPDGVAFATPAGPIAGFLSAAGLSAEPTDRGEQLHPEELTRLAADMTVLVGCWN